MKILRCGWRDMRIGDELSYEQGSSGDALCNAVSRGPTIIAPSNPLFAKFTFLDQWFLQPLCSRSGGCLLELRQYNGGLEESSRKRHRHRLIQLAITSWVCHWTVGRHDRVFHAHRRVVQVDGWDAWER